MKLTKKLNLSPKEIAQYFIAPLDNDEVWEYTSSQEAWDDMCGEAGLALVRNNEVVAKFILIIN